MAARQADEEGEDNMTDEGRPVTAEDEPPAIDRRLVELSWSIAHYSAVRDAASGARQAEAEEALTRLMAEAATLEAAYERRRWARWFFVPGGHLHREVRCPTLYESTELRLTPPASGADDAGVVTLYGWHVCTTCVPGAPVLPGFRTPGTQGQAEADASGDCLNKNPSWVNRQYRSHYGGCDECGARGVAVTSLGNLRKHKHQRKADDAAREARINDPKLIGTPTGEELVVDGDTIRTVRTAEIKLVDELAWAGYADRQEGGNPDYAPQCRANAAVIAGALAAKFNCTVEEIERRYADRMAKKLRAG